MRALAVVACLLTVGAGAASGVGRMGRRSGFLSATSASTSTRARPGRLQQRQEQRRLALAPLRAAGGDGDDDDLTDRSLSLLGRLVEGLNKELPVPTLLVPPRGDEPRGGGAKGTTTIQGWFPLSMGLALTLGNAVYPAALVGFLYLSRPVDAPDVAAAAAAAVVAGVINPLLVDVADATGLDDTFLGRLPFLLGLAATGYVLAQVLAEGKEVFVDGPRREEQARMPQAKAERDMRFFDVKLKNKAPGADDSSSSSDSKSNGGGSGEVDLSAEIRERSAGGGGGAGGSKGGGRDSRWRE